MFSRENFAIFIMEAETGTDGSFQGQLIEAGSGLDINSDIDFTQGMFSSSGPGTTLMSLASVFITQELFEIFQNNTPPNEPTRLIFVTYNISSPLFQDPTRNSTESIILAVLQSPLQNTAPPMDLEEDVQFQYQINQVLIIQDFCRGGGGPLKGRSFFCGNATHCQNCAEVMLVQF